MAVLGRIKVAPNQRLDLPDVVAFDAYSAGDWKGFFGAMVGLKPYLVKGFEVFEPNTLIGNPAGSIDITLNGSSLWWAEGVEGSFWVSLPGAANRSVTLITDATNYIEMTLALASGAEDARALWDPGANGGNGGEFTQVVDTENFLDVEISRNNTGFSDDKIPLAKIVVNSSNNVVSVTDCRPMLFRLGTGGTVPNPLNSYTWEDDPVGYSRQDTPTTMTSPSDPNIFRGADKNIGSFKEWMDAMMTRVKEIDGGSKWFQATGGSGGGGGALSLTNLFLDGQAGHSPLPDRKVTFTWSKASDGKFRSENAVSYNSPVRWTANFGQLKWNLGGAFVSGTNRAYSDYTFEVSVADGENLYLQLQRDAAINSDPIVHFENLSGVTGFCSAFGTGSFTGVACGDYIRKESNSVYQYYRIAELRVNAGSPFANGTVDGTVADATVQYLLLETHDGPIVTTDEPFRYFRKNYSEDDLVVSDVGALDTSTYWIGRRYGTMFYLRDYGDMQPGEETEVLNDNDSLTGGGVSDLTLDRAYGSVYDPSIGYALKGAASGTLLTIRRRLTDNTVGTPSGVDNSDALLAYTIASAVGTMNDNDGLWVRLGTTAGALSSGDVTDVTTDNVWEVRDPTDTPLRTYDNKNVFLVARKFTVNSVECLIFLDGTMASLDGEWVNNHLSVQGDFFLKSFTQWSVPFISTTTGKLAQNNAELFWQNTGGLDSLGQLAIRNLRISQDTVNGYDQIGQDVAQDLRIVPSLGAFTVQIGSSDSTVYIPGSLIVDGDTTSISTSILQVDDKLVSVGVGNVLNGAYGAGLEAADNTQQVVTVNTFNAQSYVNFVYSGSHPYSLGDVIGVDSNVAAGGVTAGQISGSYTVVSSGSVSGDAEIINSTTVRVWTGGTATSTASVTPSPPTTQVRTYVAPWSIRISDSSATYTSGITSWAFRVKGVATAPTLTPVSGYGIVPTAHSTNMQSGRIPFVNDDNVGPSGADTTLNFSANLSWNSGTNTLSIGGNILPATDNTYDLGSTALRWKSGHFGPGSVTVHGDATDTSYMKLSYSGSIATVGTDGFSSLQMTTGTNSGISINASELVGIFRTPQTFAAILIQHLATPNLIGSVQYGIRLLPRLFGTTTSAALSVRADLDSAAVTDASGVKIDNISLIGGATATNQYGMYVSNLTSGTNNFGVYSAQSATSNNWFLYGSGTAFSYLGGNLSLGESTYASVSAKLQFAAATIASGGIAFGSDTNLYRSAADVLKTDDTFQAASFLVGGSLRYNVAATKTATYAATTSDNVVPVSTASTTSFTVTLPAVSASNKGQFILVKDVGGSVSVLSKSVIVAPNGTDTIDGVNSSLTLDIDNFALGFVSDGSSGWMVV